MDVADEPPVAALLARAENDPNIRGLVLSGSGARQMRTEHSDLDVYVVLEDATGQETTKTPEIDTISVSLAELREVSPPPDDGGGWWFRYSFADAQVLLDRTGGELAHLLHAQATLTDDEVAATWTGISTATSTSTTGPSSPTGRAGCSSAASTRSSRCRGSCGPSSPCTVGCAPTTSTSGTSSRSGHCRRRGRDCWPTSPS